MLIAFLFVVALAAAEVAGFVFGADTRDGNDWFEHRKRLNRTEEEVDVCMP